MFFLAVLICLLPSTLSSDFSCTLRLGHCQESYLHCSGSYHSGLCSGHASRKCCVPSSGSSGTGSGVISSTCLNCICKLESGCRPLGCKWDVNSDSCGYYQIKQVYWIDCGRPGGSLHKCALDKHCATECVKTYMRKYGRRCARGHTPTCEDYARIHNGGPGGCHNGNTLGYWSKIQARGCSRHS